MNRLFFTIILLAATMGTIGVGAQQTINVKADNVVVERNGNLTKVDMDVVLSDLKVRSNRAVIITPYLVNGTDSLALKRLSIYGRRRYIYTERNAEDELMADGVVAYRASSVPATVSYQDIVAYEPWQSGAKLILKAQERGCCNDLLVQETADLTTYKTPAAAVVAATPELIYVKAEAQQHKVITLGGKAYVQFPVNQTVIYEDYRSNTRELAKIVGLIDTLKHERDVVITGVTLKGYASPEGSYANNERLAKGRVEAVKNYVNNMYRFDSGVVTTSYEPEDWEGLRDFVTASNLADRSAILAIIDSALDPDVKESTLRSAYPESYAFLLQHSFPSLRHTDYAISCDVKRYVDPVEIKELLQRNPRMLSLNEIYLLANTYETGSDEFNDLYETAVRLFPNDPVANLNVANVAIRRGELDHAAAYLDKSGTSAEATYTRGVVAYLKGDKSTAKSLLQSAAQSGISAAAPLLQQLGQ